jgi:hypothetical protein
MEPTGNRLRRHAPATLRNREPILAVQKRALPATGVLLEVASGSGENAAFIAPRLPLGLDWQPKILLRHCLVDSLHGAPVQFRRPSKQRLGLQRSPSPRRYCANHL